MILHYAATFSPSLDSPYEYNVELPDFGVRFAVPAGSIQSMKKAAVEELGMLVYDYKDEGKPLPSARMVKVEQVGNVFIDYVSCDYDKFIRGLRIRNIDLS